MSRTLEDYEIVIGLEVHVELATKTKIFCGCANKFGSAPNTQVCPVCLGLPGTLPVLNERVVEFAVKAGLALDCEIATISKFDRKQYFYPDLDKAYQISQFDVPICGKGKLEIEPETALGSGKKMPQKTIGVTRIHIEEDAGKLLHAAAGGQIASSQSSLVDYNRAGVPLIEIVSEPDMRSAEEAVAYLDGIKEIVRYTGVSDGNMEEGSLRCDANVSVRLKGSSELGTRAEVKNMNSFKNVAKAIQVEAVRQVEIIESGGKIHMETRSWDAAKMITRSMRSKEEAHDYRYFPEPDLVPVVVSASYLEKIKKELPELPEAKRARLVSEYGIPEYDAGVLTADAALADFYEALAKQSGNSKAAANWMMGELMAALNKEGKSIEASPVSIDQLSQMIQMIDKKTISGKIAKGVFEEMLSGGGKSADQIVKEKGLVQVSDERSIAQFIDEAIAANPGPVAQYKSGKEGVIGFLVGAVMKVSKGKANPGMVNQLLKEKLKSP